MRYPIGLFVKACRFEKLRDAISRAIEEEAKLKSKGVRKTESFNSNTTYTPYKQFSNNVNKNNTITCQLCGKMGHMANSCYSHRAGPSTYTHSLLLKHLIQILLHLQIKSETYQ